MRTHEKFNIGHKQTWGARPTRSRLVRCRVCSLAATGALPSSHPRVARLPPGLARLPAPAERSNAIIASHDAAAAVPLRKTFSSTHIGAQDTGQCHRLLADRLSSCLALAGRSFVERYHGQVQEQALQPLEKCMSPPRIPDCAAVMGLRLEFVSGGGSPWFNGDWSFQRRGRRRLPRSRLVYCTIAIHGVIGMSHCYAVASPCLFCVARLREATRPHGAAAWRAR